MEFYIRQLEVLLLTFFIEKFQFPDLSHSFFKLRGIANQGAGPVAFGILLTLIDGHGLGVALEGSGKQERGEERLDDESHAISPVSCSSYLNDPATVDRRM
jgi:hypothetical protein